MGQPRIGRWVFPGALAAALILGVVAVREGTASHEDSLVGDPLAPWTVHLQKADEALAAKNVSAAVRAWHEAYVSALGSRRWEGMVAVGDAYLRIGQLSGSRRASEAKARELYLAALFRARNQHSVDGAIHAGEAFAALGDREAAEQCVRVAEGLAKDSGDPQARDRVRAFAERLAARLLAGAPVLPF